MTAYNGDTYAWQNGRQLTSITPTGKNIQYKYNDSGIRTSKTVNGTTTNYYLDGDKVVYEVTGNNKIYYTYDTDDNLIGFKYNNDQYYYVRNGQGDIIGILDNNLNNVVSYTYDTWGKLLAIKNASGQNVTNDTTSIGYINQYRYRGYIYDNETSMYYLNSRYYNPELCRFINADDNNAITANLEVLTDKNLFAYCGNNPIMRIDDNGQFWMLIGAVTGAIVGGIAGAAISYAVTGQINWYAVAGGAVAGALVGCGLGYLADKAVIASSWAFASTRVAASSAAIGRNFEKWYYNVNKVAKSMQQVYIKGIGRVDAISKGKIIDCKNYDWSKYKSYSGIISSFKEQGLRYMELIGKNINGQNIKSVEFFFSSKPPQEIIDTLKYIGVKVGWI